MEHLDFTLRTVRPAFVAGAVDECVRVTDRNYLKKGQTPIDVPYRRISPEGDGLRIPSLRGILRFWYRALIGESFATEELYESESRLFGSVKHGQGIRIIPSGEDSWNREVIDTDNPDLGYLGYGLGFVHRNRRPPTSSHHRKAWRDAIPAGKNFCFRAIGSTEQIDTLKDILLIVHCFGGIGARSRRGWGSLAIEYPGKPAFKADNPTEFESLFGACIVTIAGKYDFFSRQQPPAFTAFSRLTQLRCGFEGGGHFFRSSERAQIFLGKALRTSRFYDKNNPQHSSAIGLIDHDGERADFARNRLQHLPLRIVFGAPYQVKFQNPPTGEIKYVRKKGDDYGLFRRASPLILKVLEVNEESYVAVALYLRSQFFPKAEEIYLEITDKGIAQGSEAQPCNDRAITQFLNSSNFHNLDHYLEDANNGAI